MKRGKPWLNFPVIPKDTGDPKPKPVTYTYDQVVQMMSAYHRHNTARAKNVPEDKLTPQDIIDFYEACYLTGDED